MKSIALLLLVSSCYATVFTVKSGGGGSFTTIQACSNAMAAGDTCTVFAGTYNENVTVTAGTVGNYKTFNVNGSDIVTVQAFTLASHTMLIGNCLTPTLTGGGATPGTCGFTITRPSSPGAQACVAGGAITDVYVTNNAMTQCGAGGAASPNPSGNCGSGMISFTNGANNIYIQYNSLSYPNGAPGGNVGMGIDLGEPGNSAGATQHILVEGNDFSHYDLGVKLNTLYSIIRNNYFHDQLETEGCENQHTDMVFTEPPENVQFNFIEGNWQWNAVGANAKGTLAQGDGCSGGNCDHIVVRFQTTSRLGSGYLDNEITFPHAVVYSSTFVDTLSDAGRNAGNPGEILHYNNTANGVSLNNLFYFAAAVVGGNPIGCDGTSCSTLTYGYSLGYCNVSGSANCLLYGHQYQTGSFASETGNKYGRTDTTPTNNPLFVNYVANSPTANFSLQSGSPAIAAGTNLTTVAAGDSGSGTSLVVNDATFFEDGMGLTNANSTVSGDCIAVTTVGNHVCVTAVNYSTNTLTMASGFSRSSGDAVWLYSDSSGTVRLTGSAPDLGAFQFVQTIFPGPYMQGVVKSGGTNK